MPVSKTLFLILAGMASASTALHADPIVSETFSGYPDNALISASPAGPAIGLAGDWVMAPDN